MPTSDISLFNKLKRRNLALNLVALIAASSVTAYAFAATNNYDRIKKDISIMIGIVQSSIMGEEVCKRCDVRVSGHYLADQGVVFNVSPEVGFHYGVGNVSFDHDVDVVVEGLESIPDFVNDIISGVRVEVEGAEFNGFDFINNNGMLDEVSRETRQELREVRAELREQSRELREVEIEAIHANEKEIKELEKREKHIESEIAGLEDKERTIRQRLEAAIEKRTQETQARKAKREEERNMRFEEIESVVLNTFCDYSSTMRNLPKGERISIIVNKANDSSNIYVFEQSKLDGCDSADGNVRKHALSYAF